jgi:hypothetical protein
VATPQAELRLTLTDAPDDQAQAVIRGGLTEYNTEEAGYRDSRPLGILVSDPETGEVIGGLLGRTSMGRFFVDLFFLPESLRKKPHRQSNHQKGGRRSEAAWLQQGRSVYGDISIARLLRAARLRSARPDRMRSAGSHANLYDKAARCRPHRTGGRMSSRPRR